MITSLGYMMFEVSDVPAWQNYAEGFLGMMPGDDADGAKTYRIDNRSWRFALKEGPADDIALIGLETADAASLETVKHHLTQIGIAFTAGDVALKKARGVIDLITLTDPAGMTVEVFYGATERHDRPFFSPIGVSRFRTGDQGAGHVVLQSAKVAEMRDFYVTGLGFRLSDTIGLKLSADFTLMLEFYHCNPRHHTLALTPVPAPKRLHHFMVEMGALDDVGFALDRIQPCKVKQQLSLGKHSNDQMVSFYAKTPSGFEVEVGWGGVEVDDRIWSVSHHDKMSIWGHRPVTVTEKT